MRLRFLRDRLASLRGEYDAAGALWERAAKLSGESGARAFLALIEDRARRGAPATGADLDRLEGLALTWRGHVLQLEVARLVAELGERDGRLADALRALEDVAFTAPGQAVSRAAARLASDLLRR